MKVNFNPMTEEAKAAAKTYFEEFDKRIATHDGHAWKQVGRCVYCDDCKTRLYQGRIPKSHTNIVTRQTNVEPQSTTEMRARWGKL